MPLSAGTRLGPYEVVAPIGAGGMGEVYRARDTRLDRDVAVKVLPERLADDPQALARFDPEAAVAALNHPNIVALFDVGHEGPKAFAVTELLEGQTLRERLSSGAVSTRQTLDYARQIADALAAAHDRGIVHRDLKPENVFLTADGRVKVLDFGLAQMAAPVGSAPRDSGDVQTAMMTSPGLIVGTVGYMAPEQVRGQTADARTDIFAFGLVFYEMLTGTRAFQRDTAADTMSAVLNLDPPDIARSGLMVSPAVERIVRRCLEKSPAQRFQSARDLSFAIEAVALGNPSASRGAMVAATGGRLGRLVLGGMAIVAAIAAAYVIGRRTSTPVTGASPVHRYTIPAGVTTGQPTITISPDGKYIAYASPGTGSSLNTNTALWLRPLDGLAATQIVLPMQVGNTYTFWSPDSRRFGYFSGNAILTVEIPDGVPKQIATLPEAARRAAWGSHGVMIVTTGTSAYRVPVEGGQPQAIVKIDPAKETSLSSPSFLPDGDRFLYTVITGPREADSEIRVATVDGRVLGAVATGATSAFYADGHLIYGTGGVLYAQPFDQGSAKTTGASTALATSVVQDWRTSLFFAAASETGTLVYRPAPNLDVHFTWVDRAGRELSTIAAVDAFTNFSVSPDGSRIMASRRDPVSSQNVLWLIDTARGVASLAVPKDDEGYGDPTWMPDGQHIVFRYQRQLAMRLANGGDRTVLAEVQGYPDSVTRDGRFVLYGVANGTAYELNALDILTPGAKPIPLVTGRTLADEGKFSPNGRWVAYHSNEGGGVQVSVVPFPPTGEKWQISQTGGVQPRWSKDGQELFYLDLDGRMMSVRMPESDPHRAATPVALFSTGLAPSNSLDQFEPVGDKFLLRIPSVSAAVASPVGVIVNWKQLVK